MRAADLVDQLVDRLLDRMGEGFGDVDTEAGTNGNLAVLVEDAAADYDPDLVMPWC